jgi:hypothetical protein
LDNSQKKILFDNRGGFTSDALDKKKQITVVFVPHQRSGRFDSVVCEHSDEETRFGEKASSDEEASTSCPQGN